MSLITYCPHNVSEENKDGYYMLDEIVTKNFMISKIK